MGLNTYAERLVSVPDEEFAGVPPLYGRTGASFRGKVYGDAVKEITGISLYQEFIPLADVEDMADSLERAAANGYSYKYEDNDLEIDYSVSNEEIGALAKWFRRAADLECVVVGWW